MRLLSLLFLICTVCSPLLAQEAGDNIFRNDIVHEIRIDFTTTDFYTTLEKNYIDNYGMDIPYMMVSVSIDGTEIDSVGTRIKGFTSYEAQSKKKPFKLDFNEFVKGQEFDGLRKLNLNNGYGDPAMQRDAYSYHLLRMMGVPAPRTSYAKLYLNDEYWGVYLLVEQVDKQFIKDNFGYSKGNLFKNVGWSSLEWEGDDVKEYQENFELKTNKKKADWSGFVRLVNIINNTSDAEFKDSISAVFNVDRFLRVMAVDVFSGNWDSYLDNARNWYMYEDTKTGLFHWIPWDYNLAMGGVFPDSSSYTTDFFDFSLKNPAEGKILVNRLLKVPAFQTRYYEHFCHLLNEVVTDENTSKFIGANRQLLDDIFKQEPKAIYSYEVFSEDIGESDKGLIKALEKQRDRRVKELADLYTCPVNTDITGQSITINELVASNDSTSNVSDSVGDFDDWIELYNNTSSPIDLSNAYLSDNKEKLNMWKFPDNTIIKANDYLIVWADKDEEQEGLHASFKLSKKGESVFLTNANQSIIDSVTYTELETNMAYARVPNGTGNFKKQASTFGKNNQTTTSVPKVIASKINMYPNPTSGLVTIDFEKSDQYEIYAYALDGQKVKAWRHDSSSKRQILDVSDLVRGPYMLRIISRTTSAVQMQKLIKL